MSMIDLVASEKQRQFGLDQRDTLSHHCREGEVRFPCHARRGAA